MFVVARQIARRFFGVRLFATPQIGQPWRKYSSMSSFRHGVPEPQVNMDVSDASLRTWMPAVHAGMTDAIP
jgi:hypothetical protein